MERPTGIEPVSPAWKAGVIAVIRQSHGGEGGIRTLAPALTRGSLSRGVLSASQPPHRNKFWLSLLDLNQRHMD